MALLSLRQMKILMVCLGNICRSPLAEGILKHKAKEAGLDWTVDSAGTNGYHVGEAPHKLSQKVALLHGIDISDQVARRFHVSDFDNYDRIYVMADDVLSEMKQLSGGYFENDKVSFFLEHSYPGQNKNVPDPWYGDEDGYHEVYDLINKNCEAIISDFQNKK